MLGQIVSILVQSCVQFPENSVSGTSTLNTRKQRQRNYRQSSVPKLSLQDDYGKSSCKLKQVNIVIILGK